MVKGRISLFSMFFAQVLLQACTCSRAHARTKTPHVRPQYGAGFSSEQCPEGLVCVAANTLRILTIQRLGEVFNQQTIKLGAFM